MAPKDADIVLTMGASHWVTVQVHRFSEEVDPAVAHLRADQYRLGWVRMEVGETACSLDAAGGGVKMAAVAGEPLGIIPQEHPVERFRGAIGGRGATTGFVPPDFVIYAVLRA